ncbi:MAG: acyltransferase [Pseudomonadota bacterium]
MRWRTTALAALTTYFRRVKVPQSFESIRAAPSSYTIVTQSDSPVFEALLASFARRSGLAGVSYCDQAAIERPETRRANTLYWLSIHDAPLLDILAPVAHHHQLTSFNIFERRGPIRTNPQHKINRLRRIGIVLAARFLVIIFGEPLPGNERGTVSGKQLARRLKLDFYRNLKLVRGTPFQSIEAQERLLLAGAEFEREVEIVAARQKESAESIRRKARRSFYTMAANPRRSIYVIGAPIVRFLIKRLFNSVNATGLDRLVAANKEHTVIIVPMHRSHLDYILVGSKLYESNLNPPVVAAGINLSFWPIGFIIRSFGGYFVKRNARNDRIHAMLLRRYVAYLVKRGHLHEFFIEGGRSRNGRMRAPRLGLLSIMVNAYLKGQRKEIAFVPVSITYENVVEDSVFGEENTGQKKKKESLGTLLAARDLLGKRYGEVILNFGAPISLSGAVERQRAARPGKEVDERELIASVAENLTDRIRTQTNPSLTSLAVSALMMAPRYGMTRSQLAAAVRNLARLIDVARAIDPEVGAPTPALQSFLAGRDHILDSITRGGIVSSGGILGDTGLFIEGKRRFTADFYRNGTAHLFWPGALLAAAELARGHIDIDFAMKLFDIFAADYLLGERADFERALRRHIAELTSRGILTEGNGSVTFADRAFGIFNPIMLLAPIQTILWIYDNLVTTPGMTAAPGPAKVGVGATPLKTIPYGAFVTQLHDDFERAVYLNLAVRTEAASRTNIESALESLHQRGVINLIEGGGHPKDIAFLKESVEEIGVLREAERAISGWLVGGGELRSSGAAKPALRLVDRPV